MPRLLTALWIMGLVPALFAQPKSARKPFQAQSSSTIAFGLEDACGEVGGRIIVEHSLAMLKEAGIRRCSIFLVVNNAGGEAFWTRLGWRERTDLKAFARDL